MAVEKSIIGTLTDGRVLERYTLRNANGVEASFTNLGAIWLTMCVPDKDGKLRDVVLGYDTPEAILADPGHMGAPIGRNANRIGGAHCVIAGKECTLAANNGVNNLHSAPDLYHQRLWDVAYDNAGLGSYVIFSLDSADGDQGYPGNAHISVTYTLTDDDALEINYKMVCDQDTIANFTNHAYFNMDGHDAGSVLDQLVWINADQFTPADAGSIPTGELRDVEGTPMDFREGRRIGDDIDADFDQLQMAGGYDHNWCLNDCDGDVRLVARILSEKSGIAMEVYTDLEGMQFYTGNFLNGACAGKGGAAYLKRYGCCFETQHYPDAVNKPQFPTPILKAGEEMDTTTIYRFTTGE